MRDKNESATSDDASLFLDDLAAAAHTAMPLGSTVPLQVLLLRRPPSPRLAPPLVARCPTGGNESVAVSSRPAALPQRRPPAASRAPSGPLLPSCAALRHSRLAACKARCSQAERARLGSRGSLPLLLRRWPPSVLPRASAMPSARSLPSCCPSPLARLRRSSSIRKFCSLAPCCCSRLGLWYIIAATNATLKSCSRRPPAASARPSASPRAGFCVPPRGLENVPWPAGPPGPVWAGAFSETALCTGRVGSEMALGSIVRRDLTARVSRLLVLLTWALRELHGHEPAAQASPGCCTRLDMLLKIDLPA
mmetsp:Transcript_94151/g.266186  ORF Transcript_94151/g.266186 Transcript_94151/m.266186 type:complete len:308 (-) Transcript_94151:195-1118(-)